MFEWDKNCSKFHLQIFEISEQTISNWQSNSYRLVSLQSNLKNIYKSIAICVDIDQDHFARSLSNCSNWLLGTRLYKLKSSKIAFLSDRVGFGQVGDVCCLSYVVKLSSLFTLWIKEKRKIQIFTSSGRIVKNSINAFIRSGGLVNLWIISGNGLVHVFISIIRSDRAM